MFPELEKLAVEWKTSLIPSDPAARNQQETAIKGRKLPQLNMLTCQLFLACNIYANLVYLHCSNLRLDCGKLFPCCRFFVFVAPAFGSGLFFLPYLDRQNPRSSLRWHNRAGPQVPLE
jgi:hypothetical protein